MKNTRNQTCRHACQHSDQHSNSDRMSVDHHGGAYGRPFWNANATQFTYVPAFGFSVSPLAKEYLFTATDCEGKKHSFTDKRPTALLTPICGAEVCGEISNFFSLLLLAVLWVISLYIFFYSGVNFMLLLFCSYLFSYIVLKKL
jgi:hypothetical protein